MASSGRHRSSRRSSSSANRRKGALNAANAHDGDGDDEQPALSPTMRTHALVYRAPELLSEAEVEALLQSKALVIWLCAHGYAAQRQHSAGTVSYTHLTLPTIYSV